MRARSIAMLILAATAAGCTGDDTTPSADGGSTPGTDAGLAPGTDAGLPPGVDGGVGPDRDAGPRPDSDGGVCSDSCAAPMGGVTWQCEKRFMLGTNYAWRNFGGDFGGIAAWGQSGVAEDSAAVRTELTEMKAAGVNVIRWWMFPELWTEAITFDATDAPESIGGTLVADVQEALRLADATDTYIMFTPFSFDGFRPTRTESGIYTRGITPMVTDATLRERLLTNLIAPVARAVESSPYRSRMIAWDMINEPEWAMTGPNSYGGEDFTPDPALVPVSHAQMETFLNEMAAVLRANSSALITVGSAAIKWGSAWTHTDVDFYSLHYYDWVYQWFPYQTVTLASAGLTDKPVVMGEFPNAGLSAIGGHPARTITELVGDLWDAGYAGAQSWAYSDTSFPWDPVLLQSFAGMHPCETAY